MDIEQLKLTPEEQVPYLRDWDPDIQGLLDAQFAKALWGLFEWFNEERERSELSSLEDVQVAFLEALEAAGIPRPEAKIGE